MTLLRDAAATAVNAVRALVDLVSSDAGANVATVAGVLFAVFSVQRWRVEKRDERRGEAAAEALGGLLMFCDKLGDWISMIEIAVRPVAGPPSDDRTALIAETARLLRVARTEIEAYREGLHEAARRARAYLVPLEIESLNAAYGIYSQISFRLDAEPELRAAGGGSPDERFRRNVAELREARGRIQARGEETLRRIARHEDSTLVARIRARLRRRETLNKAFRL
ncbi:hypothetical protein [Anaeromyxobacter soli]|uniref:hypothetical protein n=1 Tax=Anaeromyxobacter soli TaxID=2922725 RepID=UPI001FAEF931|nr:hypothetical protein [Anaeromyxobacter sp. SG29]